MIPYAVAFFFDAMPPLVVYAGVHLKDYPPPAEAVTADQPPAIIEVLRDHGGTLGERMVLLDYLKRNGIAVRIVGVCGSACEFFLTLPKDQVCVSPQAWFGSHDINDDAVIHWERGRDVIARGFRECRE